MSPLLTAPSWKFDTAVSRTAKPQLSQIPFMTVESDDNRVSDNCRELPLQFHTCARPTRLPAGSLSATGTVGLPLWSGHKHLTPGRLLPV
jgi:hypothetical protein